LIPLFGINQAWQGDQKGVTIQVTDPIILSPFAGEHLGMLLSAILKEKGNENRHGPRDGVPQGQPQAAKVRK